MSFWKFYIYVENKILYLYACGYSTASLRLHGYEIYKHAWRFYGYANIKLIDMSVEILWLEGHSFEEQKHNAERTNVKCARRM